ncbi:hypothetical protein [Aquisediminimonas profunda]|uniref:hypothetical protein n=1 Tax=Aquisediminimonas profunda TaxID=1550733 RepID=UPI001C6387BB|nr:hypothetical protein [Aquisediminimonas profunda]
MSAFDPIAEMATHVRPLEHQPSGHSLAKRRFTNMRLSHRSALIGFMACAAAAILLCAVFYILAPIAAERMAFGNVSQIGAHEIQLYDLLVRDLRRTSMTITEFIVACFMGYWALAGILGEEGQERSRPANILMFFGSLGFYAMVLNESYFEWFDVWCDQLPFHHQGFQILKIYECPSSQIFFNFLIFVSLALFVVSLPVRIISSRKAARIAAHDTSVHWTPM